MSGTSRIRHIFRTGGDTCRCVTTDFQKKKIQSALNLGPSHRTFTKKKISKCVNISHNNAL